MTAAANDGIMYDPKELLEKLDRKADDILREVRQKADLAHVESLSARIATIEHAYAAGMAEKPHLVRQLERTTNTAEHNADLIDALKQNTASQDAVTAFKRWLIPLAVMAIISGAGTITMIIQFLRAA